MAANWHREKKPAPQLAEVDVALSVLVTQLASTSADVAHQILESFSANMHSSEVTKCPREENDIAPFERGKNAIENDDSY
jgi:hypothetical protein